MPRKKRSDFEPVIGLIDEVVKVVWEDIMNIDEATYKEIEKQPPILFTSYGVVLKDDPQRLTLASHVSNEKPNPTYREAIKIPKSVIREIKVLSEAAP